MSRGFASLRARHAAILVAVITAAFVFALTRAQAGDGSAASVAPSTIKASSGKVAVFAVSLTATVPGETLNSASVRFINESGFQNSDLAADAAGSDADGVQLYRDNGSVDDALDDGDTPLSTGFSIPIECSTAGSCDAALTLTASALPLVEEGTATHFVAIRTSASITHDDRFSAQLLPGAFTTTFGTVITTTTTPDITADTLAPVAPVVSGLGLSAEAGAVHVSTPAITADAASMRLRVSSGGASCSGLTQIVETAATDFSTKTRQDLTTAAALQAFPAGQTVCYQLVDAAGNVSSAVADGIVPSSPSVNDMLLLHASNVAGAKRVTVAADSSGPRMFRAYLQPGGSGALVRAITESANGDDWVQVTSSASAHAESATSDIRRYGTTTSIAAGDGIWYSLAVAEGNDGRAVSDGVIPVAPSSSEASLLSVTAAAGAQRVHALADATPGDVYALFLDSGSGYRRAYGQDGVAVQITTTGSSATTDSTAISAGGVAMSGGDLVAYGVVGSGGNISAAITDGAIPEAPDAANVAFSDARNEISVNPFPAQGGDTLHLRFFVGDDAAGAYAAGADAVATSTTPASTSEHPAGTGLYYSVLNTTNGHESPLTADGTIPAVPSDVSGLSVSAAGGHQRVIAAADASGPRTFRLYADANGGTAWVRATRVANEPSPVEVTTTTSGATCSEASPGVCTDAIFAGAQALGAGASVGYALVQDGNDSDVAADGAIPAAPSAAGVVSDALRTFTHPAATAAAPVNVHFGGASDDAAAAYSESGADATVTSGVAASIGDQAAGTKVFYTATDAASGNESAITSDGAVPAPPSASDLEIVSLSAVASRAGARAIADAAGPRTFRAFLDPAGGTAWQAAVAEGGVPVEVATEVFSSARSSTGDVFVGGNPVEAGDATGFALVGDGGHVSEVATHGTIPAAPDVAAASATAAGMTVTAASSAATNVRVFVSESSVAATAYDEGVRVTLDATQTKPVSLPASHYLFYTALDVASGNESGIVADGSIPAAVDASATEASDALDRFVVPDASPAYPVRIYLDVANDALVAYANGHDYEATSSPHAAGADLPAENVFFTRVEAASGNESPLSGGGAIPAAADASALLAASAAQQRLNAAPDTSSRTFRLYADAAGGTAYVRATTTSGGDEPVEITTVNGFASSSAAGIYVDGSALGTGASVAYAVAFGRNDSDVTADGVIPAPPSADHFTLDASQSVATIASAAPSGTYRAFGQGGAPRSSAISHTNGAETNVPTGSWIDGEAIGYGFVGADGNESVAMSDGTVPIVSAPDLMESSDTGIASDDNVTNDTTPLVGVGATPGSTVTLRLGAAVLGTGIADQDGHASITSSTLDEGSSALTALASIGGNTSNLSQPLNVTVDTIAPGPPASALTLAASDDTGVSGDSLTNIPSPKLLVSGAFPLSPVRVYRDASVVGSANASNGGSASPIATLDEGANTLTWTHTDLAGNESAASPEATITVDLTAPEPPDAPDLQAASDTGASQTDDVTRATTPGFTVGGVEDGGFAVLRAGAVELGRSATANVVVSSPLNDGTHFVVAIAEDVAGNQSSASPVTSIHVDTTAPAAPAAPELLDDTGASASDGLTNVAQPRLRADASEAGLTVELREQDATLASGTADADGDATLTPGSPLSEGAHELAMRVTDLAGNDATSPALTVTLDLTAPDVPGAPDLVAASDSGSSDSDDVTNIATPMIAVEVAETQAAARIFDWVGIATVGTSTASAPGTLLVTLDPLDDGEHMITWTVTDAAGNASGESEPLTITVDTGAPAAPSAPVLSAASDTGRSSSDGITADSTPTVEVAGVETGATVAILDGGAVTASSGLTLPALGDGEHTLTATATDAAGNTSAASAPLMITIDTVAPSAPQALDLDAASDTGWSSTDDITKDATPSFTTAAEPFAAVEVLDGENVAGSAIASDAGAAVVTTTPLGNGVRSVRGVAIDVAGNRSAASSAVSVTIDTVAPGATHAAPASLGAAPAVTFTENVAPVNAANTSLRLTGTTTPVKATVSYASKRATLTPASALVAGQRYDVVVGGANPPTDVAGNRVVASVFAFRASTLEQEVSWSGKIGWRIVSAQGAHGGSYAVERAAGANASIRFTGTTVTWYSITGPDQGWARVSIDGKVLGTYNNYAARRGVVHRTFSGLTPNAMHVLSIGVVGKKGHARATDQQVVVDAIKINAVMYPSPNLTYGWRRLRASSASGGYYNESNLAGAAQTLTFRGRTVRWYPVFGPNRGRVDVTIDGKRVGTYDTYSRTTAYGKPITFTGLADAVHTIRIVVTGQKNRRSTGSWIATDRWAIG